MAAEAAEDLAEDRAEADLEEASAAVIAEADSEDRIIMDIITDQDEAVFGSSTDLTTDMATEADALADLWA